MLKVRDVRTNDDTLITVKLMVFYELRDIETMVTHMYNAYSYKFSRDVYFVDATNSAFSQFYFQGLLA